MAHGYTHMSDLTLPVAVSQGGNGVTSIPSASAYAGGTTSCAANGFTKVAFNTEDWDTGSYFASNTYTPLVAGVYQVNWSIFLSNPVATTLYGSSLYKAGARYKDGAFNVEAGTSATVCGSALVKMNGTTDTLDIYVYNGHAATAVTAAASLAAQTYFHISWIAP